MDKLKALLNLLRQENEVSNPGAWKNATIVANLILAVAAVAAAWGFDIKLSADDATNLAAGAIALVGVVNGIMHCITSARAGLPPASPLTPIPPAQG